MGRWGWGALVVAGLWTSASRAEDLQLSRSLAPPPTESKPPPEPTLVGHGPLAISPGVPDRGVFEELLFSFADPDRVLSGGLAAPTLSLAIRSRAWAFVPTGKYEQQDALNTLSEPTRNLTMGELPGGKRLASLIDLGPDGEQVRLRDLGPRLSGTNGPLQRGLNSVIDYLHVPKPVAILSASAAALGAIYQFGTGPITGLGVPVLLNENLLKGRVNTTLQLTSTPHFQNARGDVSARFKLPVLELRSLRVEQVELGGAVMRTTADGVLIDTRWANLRGRVAWLEWCWGVHADRADPHLWMLLETRVQRDRLNLHAIFNKQWDTGHSRLMATATVRTGPVLTGLFVGGTDRVNRTFGVVGMAAF